MHCESLMKDQLPEALVARYQYGIPLVGGLQHFLICAVGFDLSDVVDFVTVLAQLRDQGSVYVRVAQESHAASSGSG